MPGRKQTTPEQEAEIAAGHLLGRSASQIHRVMEAKGLLSYPHPDVTLRLVQSRVRGMTPPDDSDPWSLTSADPDEAQLVLDVVADAFRSTQGRVWPSKAHVAQIARLRKAVPDMPSIWAHGIARAYQLCAAQGRDSRYLDFALGARPWESASRADSFARLLGEPLPSESLGLYGDSLMVLLILMSYKGSLDDMRERIEDYSRGPIPEPRLQVATAPPPPQFPEWRTASPTDLDTLFDTLADGQSETL